MNVIPLTIAVSLGLVGTFVLGFLRERSRGAVGNPERDSLLPLAAEIPTAVPARGECGCHRGERPPCAGCRRASRR